eukprot:GCRY01005540.1.p1 GENE.GCRY01005540.1~~GCRY01005540.1.p1  ORF type:complete len:410 (+),score=88.42 GCRY01005540.1:126-1355(+)
MATSIVSDFCWTPIHYAVAGLPLEFEITCPETSLVRHLPVVPKIRVVLSLVESNYVVKDGAPPSLRTVGVVEEIEDEPGNFRAVVTPPVSGIYNLHVDEVEFDDNVDEEELEDKNLKPLKGSPSSLTVLSGMEEMRGLVAKSEGKLEEANSNLQELKAKLTAAEKDSEKVKKLNAELFLLKVQMVGMEEKWKNSEAHLQEAELVLADQKVQIEEMEKKIDSEPTKKETEDTEKDRATDSEDSSDSDIITDLSEEENEGEPKQSRKKEGKKKRKEDDEFALMNEVDELQTRVGDLLQEQEELLEELAGKKKDNDTLSQTIACLEAKHQLEIDEEEAKITQSQRQLEELKADHAKVKKEYVEKEHSSRAQAEEIARLNEQISSLTEELKREKEARIQAEKELEAKGCCSVM